MDESTYEINIKRFIQSTEYQLSKLKECIDKSNELHSYQDWQNVKKAQLNASQIVKRIKSDIKEMEKIRNQIRELHFLFLLLPLSPIIYL